MLILKKIRYEVISNANIRIYSFLNRLKIAFFVVAIALIVLQVVLSILTFFIPFNNIVPLGVIFIAVSAGFLIFYIVTAVKLSYQIRQSLGMMIVATEKIKNLQKVRLSKKNPQISVD